MLNLVKTRRILENDGKEQDQEQQQQQEKSRYTRSKRSIGNWAGSQLLATQKHC